jgi:pimeloyl-ACP methyl ester carboxylesterase
MRETDSRSLESRHRAKPGVTTQALAIGDLLLDAAFPSYASRPPLLMVHGIMGGAWYFARWLEAFAQRGYPAYAINLRGHHGSRPVEDFGRVSVMDYVDDVIDALSDLRARFPGTPPILLGHSMGSLIVQKVAESEETAALVLASVVPPRGIPLLSWPLVRRELKHVPAMLASRVIQPSPDDMYAVFFNRLTPEEARSFEPRWTPASGRVGLDISLGRVAVDPSRIGCPVLVVAGSDDVAIPPRIQRRVAHRYKADLRVFAGNAHFLVWEAGWDRVAGEIGAWLDHHVPRPGALHAAAPPAS